ncbi:MAG: hypothetical protein NTW22_06550, partial [Proteobacteria bacterium]|nr:hypothetical protein [Pseudomonadota bacterium]
RENHRNTHIIRGFQMTNLRIVKHVFLSLLLTSGAVYSATFDEQPDAPHEQTTVSTVRGIKYPISHIEHSLESRTTTVNALFPSTHIRNVLGNEIKTEFDKAMAAYKKSASTEEANSILVNLGEFCAIQELKLYKLHYSRHYTEQGHNVYEYDCENLRQIEDFTMSESKEDLAIPSMNLLKALGVIDRRLNSWDFIKELTTTTADEIFSKIQNHALIKDSSVTKSDIAALIDALRQFRS